MAFHFNNCAPLIYTRNLYAHLSKLIKILYLYASSHAQILVQVSIISTTFLSRKTVKTFRVIKFIYLNKEFLYHQSEQKFGFSMLFCIIMMNLEVKTINI